jgi:thioredoxin 1
MMERLLLILGAGFVLIVLAYGVFMQVDESSLSLEELNQIHPEESWFQETVLENPRPVLVEFGATWCGPCKQLNVVLKDLEVQYGDRLAIVKIDIDENPALAQQYQIDGIPVLMVFQDGKVMAAEAGLIRYESVEQLILPYLQTPGEKPASESAPPAASESANAA